MNNLQENAEDTGDAANRTKPQTSGKTEEINFAISDINKIILTLNDLTPKFGESTGVLGKHAGQFKT